MLKVLGPHELDKYSRNAAFVNKSRIFFDLETYYTIVVYSTGAIQPWSTKQYILGMCMASLSFLLAVRLPAHCQMPRGIHVEGLWGTYWGHLLEVPFRAHKIGKMRQSHDFGTKTGEHLWNTTWLCMMNVALCHGHASEEWHQRRAAGNPQAGEIALADLMELGYSNPQEKKCNSTYWTLSMTSLFYLLCLFGVYYIRRPRQTQGGARQGIRQASLAAPAARAAAVAAAACSSGRISELARPSEARCFPPGRWFFRSCFTAAAAGNRSCRKRLFF